MHGDGIEYDAKGNKLQGKWNNGKKLKELVKKDPVV